MDEETFLVNRERAVDYLNSLEKVIESTGCTDKMFLPPDQFHTFQMSIRYSVGHWVCWDMGVFSWNKHCCIIVPSGAVCQFSLGNMHVPSGLCQWSVLELGSWESNQSSDHISSCVPFTLHAQHVSTMQSQTPLSFRPFVQNCPVRPTERSTHSAFGIWSLPWSLLTKNTRSLLLPKGLSTFGEGQEEKDVLHLPSRGGLSLAKS
jgi:hypothetical protein